MFQIVSLEILKLGKGSIGSETLESIYKRHRKLRLGIGCKLSNEPKE